MTPYKGETRLRCILELEKGRGTGDRGRGMGDGGAESSYRCSFLSLASWCWPKKEYMDNHAGEGI